MTLPVEQKEEKADRSSPMALVRRSGLLAVAGGPYSGSSTVQNHISNIFRKLQVADRAQAVIRAREAGIGEDRTLP